MTWRNNPDFGGTATFESISVSGTQTQTGNQTIGGTLGVTGATTLTGALQANSTITVGVDDTGHDVTFFGATAGQKVFWDESADTLNLDCTVQQDGTLTIGVDDTGYDVIFYGATASANMTWDESADTLLINGTAKVKIGDDTTLAFGAGSDGTIEYDEDGTDQVRVAGATWVMPGVQFTPVAATATADGLTTGLIPLGSTFVSVTSADANNIVTLPAGTAGQNIMIYVGANGCELRTPAASTATINNVNSDGTNELALGATTSYIATCVATDTWVVRGFTALGADQAALVPDAA